MNLVELKKMKISELTTMAKDFSIEGATGMPKQELIFSLLQAHSDQNGLIYGVSWKSCPMDSASLGPQIPITYQGPTISTYPLHKFGVST